MGVYRARGLLIILQYGNLYPYNPLSREAHATFLGTILFLEAWLFYI